MPNMKSLYLLMNIDLPYICVFCRCLLIFVYDIFNFFYFGQGNSSLFIKCTSYLFTYSMNQNTSWEANRFLASQEIPRILWNPQVHYHIHKFPDPTLSKMMSPVPRTLWIVRNWYVLRRGAVRTSPNPQAEGPTLVDCPRLLIQYIRCYPPYWRPFFHLQPEAAPCRGDTDPLIMDYTSYRK
jgi:hypothetical protein